MVERLSETVKIGGYLVAGGAIVGFSIGIYLLFNRPLFSFFIRISQFEVMSYFLSVFMPSFVILIIIGYVFATTFGLKKVNLSNVVPLCVLSLLCMVLSTLSVFYFVSFLGGFLTLTALIRAYTKPTFKTLSKTEAFFLVEIGTMLVASFSSLFFLMWLISNSFQTYPMGFYGSYSPYALLLIGVFSFFVFFATPLLGSRGTNVGFCGTFGLSMSILSYLLVLQNRYVLFNSPTYIGMFMLIVGSISTLVGDLIYLRLFFFEPVAPPIAASSILYDGRYCPYCGKPRISTTQNLCYSCERSLMWTPYAPFCSFCGHLVPTNAQTCPHCQEDIKSKQIYFQLKDTSEQKIASKVITDAMKKKSWIMTGLRKMSQLVGQALWSVNRLFNAVIKRLSLTLREAIIMIILTYVLIFLSFIGYVRVETSKIEVWDTVIFSYGFPLEWFQMFYYYPLHQTYAINVDIVWISLALDVLLYFLLSFALVYGVIRLKSKLWSAKL